MATLCTSEVSTDGQGTYGQDDTVDKHDEARQLTNLTRGRLVVRYCPKMFEGDEEFMDPRPTAGHMFSVNFRERIWSEYSLEPPPEEDFTIDDRDGPLKDVLVSAIRKEAAKLETLAREIEVAA